MALHLARRKQRLPSNPSLIQFFSNYSSDSKDGNAPGEKPSQSPSDSSNSSPLTDIISRINRELGNPQEHRTKPFTTSDAQPQNRGGGLHDLAKNLAKFERRSTAPPPRDGTFPSQSRPPVSFEALFKQNSGNQRGQDFNSNKAWENLKNLSAQSNKPGLSLGSFKSSLKSVSRDNVVQGGGASPMSLFSKEMEKRKGKQSETGEMKTEFLTNYGKEELGEKLRMLRPEGSKEFSLQELNERLVKLRQEKEKEKEADIENEKFVHLRNMVENFKDSAKKEADSQQNYNFLGYLGHVPEYKLHPPKEGLIETYFHPDNLSSAEKMKIELTNVREEFKMSESDCGSARVQVAQLTTKIKHLSKALHKKDKHSRKGLMGMVQKRKKLLKYIRRTDWDSYCLVLSKLGLRDNPDYKF